MKEKKVKCDVCGEEYVVWDMTLYGGVSNLLHFDCVNLEINTNQLDHPESKRVEKMFGKGHFNICFCCLLVSLGVKTKLEKKLHKMHYVNGKVVHELQK